MYVVKIGGALGNDAANTVRAVKGIPTCVLVHGGSAAADEISTRLGRPPRRVTSSTGFESRRTDLAALEAITMAIAGRQNTHLVAALQAEGVNALGLCGADGRLLVGRRKDAIRLREGARIKLVRDDRTGTVEAVNSDLLRRLLEAGYQPVLSPPILDASDGGLLNADADRIAAKVASALSADALVLLTNVPGLLRDREDPSSRVDSLAQEAIGDAIRAASGGMKKKLLAAREALEGGVRRVIIADSRRPDPVRTALSGVGTVIR